MRRSRVAIRTAMLTTAVRVDTGFEGDIRALVVADNALGEVAQELCAWSGILLGIPFGITLERHALKTIWRVVCRATTARRKPAGSHGLIFIRPWLIVKRRVCKTYVPTCDARPMHVFGGESVTQSRTESSAPITSRVEKRVMSEHSVTRPILTSFRAVKWAFLRDMKFEPTAHLLLHRCPFPGLPCVVVGVFVLAQIGLCAEAPREFRRPGTIRMAE